MLPELWPELELWPLMEPALLPDCVLGELLVDCPLVLGLLLDGVVELWLLVDGELWVAWLLLLLAGAL
jgi:hypothetical protein